MIDGDQVIYLTTSADHVVDMLKITDAGDIDPNAGSDSAGYIRYDDERASTERERVIAEKS